MHLRHQKWSDVWMHFHTPIYGKTVKLSETHDSLGTPRSMFSTRKGLSTSKSVRSELCRARRFPTPLYHPCCSRMLDGSWNPSQQTSRLIYSVWYTWFHDFYRFFLIVKTPEVVQDWTAITESPFFLREATPMDGLDTAVSHYCKNMKVLN